MVGELVGDRLIAQAGSLMNLAKLPASTVQILEAEKALFKVMFIPEIFRLRYFFLMNFPSTVLAMIAFVIVTLKNSSKKCCPSPVQ